MPDPGRAIRAVLFDLGGTLVDERDFAGWIDAGRALALDLDGDALAHALREVETEVDADPLGLGRDPSVVEFWRRVLARTTEREVETATAERFVERLRATARDRRVAVFSDVRRCLDRLHGAGLTLGVISNSTSEASVRGILNRADLLHYFATIVSSGTEGIAKPDPEIFRRAVARLDVPAPASVYVGNLEHTDARAAIAAGLHGIWLHRDGVGAGDDPPEVTSLLEVPALVRRIEEAGERPGPAPGRGVK